MNKQNIVQRIGNAAERVILSRIKNTNLFAEYYNRSDRANYKKQSTQYEKQEIKDWTNAVAGATDPENPRRGDLMRFYQSLKLDLHLSAVIDTRILRVQRSSYIIVNEKGEENEELKALLERPWFDDLVSLTVGKTFQGTTLIELFDTDENGELTQVVEIPQSNFLPHKGIIINEEWDDNGTSYKEGSFKDYYIQVGSNWELGMLNQLAMIVLAKKLGLGSWMSYIEKFGVPPLFAITERMDPGRRDELFEMLSNFRMNHFAVLQGNEKIEVPNNYNVDAYNSFKSLINDVCNKEMSKRVLGGTAMVDEKSFVGSAEVQERVAQDRHEADKLLFKHYFNTQIRQRLAKLSSVYAGFANHTLVWDNQETLDINSYIDAVQKLSTSFEFDIEEVRSRTGLPITAIKTQSLFEPVNTEPQKKKPDARLKGLAPYAHLTPGFIVYAATWDADIDRLANQLYNGEVKPTDLDKDLVLKNYAAFNTEAEKAWGKGYYDESVTRNFRENFLKFAGAKSYDLMNQLANLKTDGINKEDYIDKAKGVVNRHNSAYLTTEIRFCGNAASAARDYATYMKDTDIYPNLKYRSFKDADSRESHAANDGIVKPVEEWTSLPPYDYNCRCWLEQTNEPATSGRAVKGATFNNNPYTTGDVFTNEHSYFQTLAANKANDIKVFDNTEQMKQFAPYHRSVKAGKNKVHINDFADLSDVAQNIKAAKKLADKLGKDIFIRHHFNRVKGVKNPELGIGNPNTLGDLKTFKNTIGNQEVKLENHINNRSSKASKQKCKYVVFEMTDCPAEKFKGKFTDILHNVIKPGRKDNLTHVVVIRNSKVAVLTRKQIYKQDFKGFEKEMY